MTVQSRTILFLIALQLVATSPAFSQSVPEDPVDSARIQFGPLGLTPSVALTNLGVESNVFNQEENPKRDFTFTISPQLGTWFRAGPSLLSIASRVGLVYFHAYSSERSLDGNVAGRWELRWDRLTPWVSGSYFSGRERVGYEIDLRSRRLTRDYAVGAELRVASAIRIAGSGQRTRHEHDADAQFLGSSLQEVLNRETESVAIQYSHVLTEVTTFVAHGEAFRDRFEFSPGRDSDSVRVQTGFDLAEDALVFGRARVGYRKFDGVGGGIPDFAGIVASYAVGTTIKGVTRVEVTGERDVNYSYEFAYPYYLLSGVTITATPRLTDTWDIQGRVGTQRLAYRLSPSAAASVTDRTDSYTLLSGGVGYYVGGEIRVGFNVDRQRRTSPLQSRDYEGYRIGTSVTYGQ